MVRKSFEKWKEEAILKHGDTFKYIDIEYRKNGKSYGTYLIFECSIHGVLIKEAKAHTKKGIGCKDCSNLNKRKTFENWIIDGNNKHNNFYKYINLYYENKKPFLTIFCEIHNRTFTQNATNHCTIGQKCPDCGMIDRVKNKKPTIHNKRKTFEIWKQQGKETHENYYKYISLEYIKDNREKDEPFLNIKCPKHGKFKQRAKEHIYGSGCDKCASKGCSKQQIEWLNLKNIIDNTHIQHFENKGEYKIKDIGKRGTKVDGFSKELNKVYEFHGDYYHGNPKRFNQTKIFHYDITFGELYNKTIERTKNIRKLSYKVEEMWELDWNNHKKLMKEIRKYSSN